MLVLVLLALDLLAATGDILAAPGPSSSVAAKRKGLGIVVKKKTDANKGGR